MCNCKSSLTIPVGPRGRGIDNTEILSDGRIRITYTDGTNYTSDDSIAGVNGSDGADGVSILSISFNDSTGELTINLSNGGSTTTSSLVGPTGPPGTQGPAGTGSATYTTEQEQLVMTGYTQAGASTALTGSTYSDVVVDVMHESENVYFDCEFLIHPTSLSKLKIGSVAALTNYDTPSFGISGRSKVFGKAHAIDRSITTNSLVGESKQCYFESNGSTADLIIEFETDLTHSSKNIVVYFQGYIKRTT